MKASELKSLWIGEPIRSLKTGRSGKFEGFHSSGKVRMKTAEGIVLVPAAYVALNNEEMEEHTLELTESDAEVKKAFRLPKNEIDLHIEILRPDLVNSLPERITDVQLKAFEEFMEQARATSAKSLLVIHGRGEGVLRRHIHDYLKTCKDVFQYRLVNNDGATEILRY